MDYCGSITWWVVLTWMVGLLVIIHHFPLSSPCFTRSLRPQNCYVHDINPHYKQKNVAPDLCQVVNIKLLNLVCFESDRSSVCDHYLYKCSCQCKICM